ncbi:MAG: TetR/AcrR family transcriptional regulator [Ignavibacteria bacterium]
MVKDSPVERKKIMVFADKLFREAGLYKTSMDELSSLMHISKKTIYRYFPSKENLVREIVKFWLESSTERVDKIVRGKTDVVTKFIRLLEDYSCEFTQLGEKAISDLQIHYPDVWTSIESFREEKIIFYVKKLFRQGFREKYITKIPVEIVIVSVSASISSVVNPKFLMVNNFSTAEALKHVLELHLKGIITEKGRKKYFSQQKKHLK